MLTRRAILTGTAASIGAIAATHNVSPAVAAAGGANMGCGYNNPGGGLGAFNKIDTGFHVFFKYDLQASEIFYKGNPSGGVDVFSKHFIKGWTAFSKISLTGIQNLQGSDAYFDKLHIAGGEFFIKGGNNVNVKTILTLTESGPALDVSEEFSD